MLDSINMDDNNYSRLISSLWCILDEKIGVKLDFTNHVRIKKP